MQLPPDPPPCPACGLPMVRVFKDVETYSCDNFEECPTPGAPYRKEKDGALYRISLEFDF